MIIRIINGPNINLLGVRQPDVYGDMPYAEIVERLKRYAASHAVQLAVLQSNCEGQLIDWVQQFDDYDALIINPAGYCHTSIAILDALLAVDKLKVEVHWTDLRRRQAFRSVSLTAAAADKLIMGKQIGSYYEAIDFIVANWAQRSRVNV